MSKIFRALEKAERERGKEREPKIDLPPLPEDPETPKREEVALERRLVEETGLPQIITSFQQTSQVGEQFRKLRSQILKFKGPDSPRTIMVTSAMNSEGKTFVAANLPAIGHQPRTEGAVHDLPVEDGEGRGHGLNLHKNPPQSDHGAMLPHPGAFDRPARLS